MRFFLQSLNGLGCFLWFCCVSFAQPPSEISPSIPFMPNEPPPILSAPPVTQPDNVIENKKFDLATTAFFAGEPKAINSGITWRIYKSAPATRDMLLVNKSTEATPIFELESGEYVVHVSYGLAGTSKTVVIENGPVVERFSLAAGAMRIRGSVGDNPIPSNLINFSIYVPFPDNSEGRLVLPKVRQNEIIRLPEGLYHVVSTFGNANAIMRADLKVESGELTEAVINHRAATVTLKLVSTPGGEAFAGTDFSVMTPGGDTIREASGAFPSMTLAEGEYTLIARHEGKMYSRTFMVETGLHRDIEILTTQTMQ